MRITHEAGYSTVYCHLVERAGVEPGQLVETNEHIGYVGRTGNASTPHTHFALRKDGVRQKIPGLDYGDWVRRGTEIPGDWAGLEATVPRQVNFSVRVRKDFPIFAQPSSGSTLLARVPAGTTLVAYGSDVGYFKVVYENVTGWIPISGVVGVESQISGAVTTGSVNVRSGPGTSYDVVDNLPADTLLTVFKLASITGPGTRFSARGRPNTDGCGTG